MIIWTLKFHSFIAFSEFVKFYVNLNVFYIKMKCYVSCKLYLSIILTFIYCVLVVLVSFHTWMHKIAVILHETMKMKQCNYEEKKSMIKRKKTTMKTWIHFTIFSFENFSFFFLINYPLFNVYNNVDRQYCCDTIYSYRYMMRFSVIIRIRAMRNRISKKHCKCIWDPSKLSH